MLTIGTLSKKTGTKASTIRYYEQIGLMNEPGRSVGGQRRYFEQDLDRLAFIRHSRQLGFSLEAVRELLDLSDHPSRSCAEADVVARRQLKQVEERINRLHVLKKELRRMVAECEGNSVAECKIIEVLRDHSECLNQHQS
jgi:Cu(I)-responsive transcriptional regulator